MKWKASSLFVAWLVVFMAATAWFQYPASTSADPQAMGFDELAALATEWDGIEDSIPAELKIGMTDFAEAQDWTDTVVPFFAYEGIETDSQLFYPPMSADYYDGGQAHNHILGTTSIFDHSVNLNARFFNPVDPWYGRVDTLGTLIHELAHAQGITTGSARLDEENSAQLTMLEVLAALTNKGSAPALVALVDEVEHMTRSAAYGAAIAEGRVDDYKALVSDLADDAFELAVSEKSTRYWASDAARLGEILTRYNLVPITELYAGIDAECVCIEGVELPLNKPGGKEGGSPAPLYVDDLAYVFAHIEALVGALPS